MDNNKPTYLLWKWNTIVSTIAIVVFVSVQSFFWTGTAYLCMLLATVFVYIYVIFTGFGKRNFIGGTLCSAIVIISGAMMWFLCSSNGYNTTIANNTIITIVVLFTATAVVTAIYTWAFEDVFAKASPFIFRVVVSIPFIGVVFGAPFIFVVRKRAQMIR